MARGWFGTYKDEHALRLLSEPAPHGPATLVQIESPSRSLEETNA
jgi:hypothetical protein